MTSFVNALGHQNHKFAKAVEVGGEFVIRVLITDMTCHQGDSLTKHEFSGDKKSVVKNEC